MASHLEKGGYAVGASSQCRPGSVDARASRSDERRHPAWVTLVDSAKIGPRDIMIRRGGDLAQQSWYRKLV